LKLLGNVRLIYIGTVMYELLIGESPFYSEDVPQMYHNIRKGLLSIPKHISEEAKDLLLVYIELFIEAN